MSISFLLLKYHCILGYMYLAIMYFLIKLVIMWYLIKIHLCIMFIVALKFAFFKLSWSDLDPRLYSQYKISKKTLFLKVLSPSKILKDFNYFKILSYKTILSWCCPSLHAFYWENSRTDRNVEALLQRIFVYPSTSFIV